MLLLPLVVEFGGGGICWLLFDCPEVLEPEVEEVEVPEGLVVDPELLVELEDDDHEKKEGLTNWMRRNLKRN